MSETETPEPIALRDRIANGAFLVVMGIARIIPYAQRIALMGWFFAHVLGPLAGWRQRIESWNWLPRQVIPVKSA